MCKEDTKLVISSIIFRGVDKTAIFIQPFVLKPPVMVTKIMNRKIVPLARNKVVLKKANISHHLFAFFQTSAVSLDQNHLDCIGCSSRVMSTILPPSSSEFKVLGVGSLEDSSKLTVLVGY